MITTIVVWGLAIVALTSIVRKLVASLVEWGLVAQTRLDTPPLGCDVCMSFWCVLAFLVVAEKISLIGAFAAAGAGLFGLKLLAKVTGLDGNALGFLAGAPVEVEDVKPTGDSTDIGSFIS